MIKRNDDDDNGKSDDVLTQAEGKWHRGGRKLCLKSLEGASSNIKWKISKLKNIKPEKY